MGLWLDETIETLRMDPILIYRRNEVDVVWRFDKEDSVNQFVVTSDSDYNQGYSTAKFENTSQGTAVFSGVLDTRKPKDGRVRYSGYCNITSVPKRKSFRRQVSLNWEMYSHLVLRIRGDGRCYVLNLLCPEMFDITWNNVYHYVLYTRGGPYWQYAKIPFSRFVLSSKGRIQDIQSPIDLNAIKRFGISLGDDVTGPFRLEIDYIGLEFDPANIEKHVYESYNMEGVKM
ncbi:hypothetical protein KM043_000599 [Ampulex compressa]|nr:hypothetical protein KM043_000599 [Ampulex compressa]